MLDYKDLQFMIAMIDTMAKRGAILGPEMIEIGTIRTKLIHVTEAIQKQQEAAETESQDTDTPDESPEAVEETPPTESE